MESFLFFALPAYLLGSIPFGVLLARLFRLPDPRSIGSGNIGATNMLRAGNKWVALLTLLLDAGKGAAAVGVVVLLHFAGEIFSVPFTFTALALSAAAFGHMASPWLKFSGGKGVATILGGALVFSSVVGAFACLVWLITFLFFRYVSLASIAMLALLPVMVGLRMDAMSAVLIALACAYAIYKHRSNIARLWCGEEPSMRIGKKDESHG